MATFSPLLIEEGTATPTIAAMPFSRNPFSPLLIEEGKATVAKALGRDCILIAFSPLLIEEGTATLRQIASSSGTSQTFQSSTYRGRHCNKE